MHIQPIKTRIMTPPQDDLYAVLEESISDLPEQSILVVTSKLVVIHQGRCIPEDAVSDRHALVRSESEYYVRERVADFHLGMRYGMLQSDAGIDLGNNMGYYLLLPENPMEAAGEIRQWLVERFGVSQAGVIITDSFGLPMRFGALGISVGYAGFCPVQDLRGEPDLFGKPLKTPMVNVADALAVSAVFLMGEMDEQTPLALITNLPKSVAFGDCPEGRIPTLRRPRKYDPYAPLLRGSKWRRGGQAPPREGLWSRFYRWLSGYVWRWRQWRKSGG